MSTSALNVKAINNNSDNLYSIGSIIKGVFIFLGLINVIGSLFIMSELPARADTARLFTFVFCMCSALVISIFGILIGDTIIAIANILKCQVKIEEHTRMTSDYLNKIYNQQAS